MPNGDFPRSVVETIAKGAGNSCSNPDCNALTCGPADDLERAVVIGEAAHIFGAREGSARFIATMSDEQRADITNTIWLCRNCHKRIDADPAQHSEEILFEWRRHHEREITARLGRTGDAIREKVIARQLVEFSGASYLAQQIVIDKPDLWEYKLTAELLHTKLSPILAKWSALKRGLYVRPSVTIGNDEILRWVIARFHEAQKMFPAVSTLVSEELPASWGPIGQPGDPKEILRACGLIVDAAEQILRWEETIAFAIVPDACEEMQGLLNETTGRMLQQLARIPQEMNAVLSQENLNGVFTINLLIDLPENWSDKMEIAQRKAFASLR